MKEWKVNQEIYHRLTTTHTDDAEHFTIQHSEDIVGTAIAYFTQTDQTISIYPGKSYAVALIYAKLLTMYCNESFYQVLDDPSLLYHNDPHFLPYRHDKTTYDQIIAHFGGIEGIPLEGPCVDYTVMYFKAECLLMELSEVLC